jgi:epoxyqueuosine reductase
MAEVIAELQRRLADAGFKSSIVPVEHLADAQHELTKLLDRGTLQKDFYDEITSRYGLQWHFVPPADFPNATSIIVTAIQQPKISVRFRLAGSIHDVIIPPTYLHDTDAKALSTISDCLNDSGYQVRDALVPSKLLAVHSGLARYGKNNIAYIDGWGSYFRLRAFFLDIPCTTDAWHELRMMELCKKCEACLKKCPGSAIREDTFLIDGKRCITFYNEGEKAFPEWIDPAWHNSIIGCMICQDVCPANKDFTQWIVPGDEFSEEETDMILKGVPQEQLPQETVTKLENIELIGGYDLLARNLGVLVNQ